MCHNMLTASRQMLAGGLIATLLTACAAGDARQINLAAQRLLSAAATQTAAAATNADEPNDPAATATPTPDEPSPTPLPPLVFARCIMRADLDMRLQPAEDAPAVATLKPRDIVTAYGRTEDSGWILAWNRDIAYGWVPASSLGCSAPFAELRATAPDILLTPEPTETASPTAVTAMATATATAAQPATSAPPSPTPSPTATPETPIVGPTIIVRVITVTVIVTVTAPPIVIVATPTPTVARSVETPTPTRAAPTPTPNAAPIPGALRCTVTSERLLNLRSGPDRSFRLIGRLRPGADFFATGRNADGTWLVGVTASGLRAWVISSAVSCQGALSSLPINDP
jgi:hypothetical protein